MMDLKTATTYWRESGGEYDQKSERAIISIPSLQKFVVSVIGWTLINNQDGEALLSMKDKLRTAEQERDKYKAMASRSELIKDVLRHAAYVVDYRNGDVDTEDGSFATTDLDSIIRLEYALAEALGASRDDVDLDEILPLIDNLPSTDSELESLRAQLKESALLALQWQTEEHKKHIELESLRAKIKEAQEPVGIARSDNSFLGNGDCYIDLYKDLDDNTLLYTKPVTQD